MRTARFAYKNAFYKIALEDKRCEYCGLRLERKEYPSGLESASHYNNRLYCGQQCQYGAFTGKGNPNYKGFMPKCVDCNKSVSYGSNPGSKSKRCQSCFDKWAEKTGYYANTPQAKRIAENMRQSKGITPQALKPFVFKKGQKAHNYIGGSS